MAHEGIGLARRVLGAIPFSLLIALCSLQPACRPAEGCMGGDDGVCLPRSACERLDYVCEDQQLEIRLVTGPEDRPAGQKATAAPGDILLRNARLTAVIDAPGSPHFLSPGGGSVVDLVPREPGWTDELDQVMQAIGILPDDAAHYHSVQLIDERPTLVAAVFRGRLDGRPDIDIVTRYEVRPCEPGIRVRTEIHHGGRDPLTMFPADAFFWGDRSVAPFLAGRGLGFDHPELDLEEAGEAFRDVPFVAGDAHTTNSAAYGLVACDSSLSSGFHSNTLSATGAPRSIVMPGDSRAWERFLVTAPGPGASHAIDVIGAARAMLHGDAWGRVSGRVVDDLGMPVGGDERRAALLFYEPASGADPDARSGRTTWSEAIPDAQGRFELSLPLGRSFRIEVWRMGRPLEKHVAIRTDSPETTLQDALVVSRLAKIHARVSGPGDVPLVSELVLTPDSAEPDAARGSVFGLWNHERCSPYLGPPHGASPACNRVVVDGTGEVEFELNPGVYHVYATHGPFWSLARRTVSAEAGTVANVELSLSPLDILPSGVLSADFHVHGGASFDSSLPDRDRVLQFIAAGTQVIAATDHDVVTSYDKTLRALALDDQVRVMSGVETTGQILFLRPPGSDIPRVIGHFNHWPIHYDERLPRNGAPDDEKLEPGALFEKMTGLFEGKGVRQLNHPYGETELGRDMGYFRAVGYDPRKAIPQRPDGTNEGELARRSPGGFSNLDFDAQEVMNGASISQHLMYRAAWFSLLNQGFLRTGTANSDSHTAAVETLGYPRNLVFGGHRLATFDPETFNASVRNGELVGTSGPVMHVCLTDANGTCQGPSFTPVLPSPDSSLHVTVVSAPWIPVSETRVFVNGQLVHKRPLDSPSNAGPFGLAPLGPWQLDIPLGELLAQLGAGEDAWIVVEAGLPLDQSIGYDEDGLPDPATVKDAGRVEQSDPRYHVQIIAPGVWPTAFSNPILVDRAGDGWRARGRP